MKKVCFLINATETLGAHNPLFLANALNDRGDCVYLGFVDSLAMHAGEIVGKVLKVNHPLREGVPLDVERFRFENLRYFDYIWILGFGIRESFLDKIQILWSLSQQTKIINSIDSLLFLHSKYHLSTLTGLVQYPETYVSSDFEFLWQLFNEKKGTWIVKPPAESFGRDVFILRPGDSNVRVILQAMTGYGSRKKYCIMQRFIPEISFGEKRVLFAGGHVVGQYKRIARHDHRTNIHQGAEAVACDLTSEESDLCNRLGEYLIKLGAYFVGVDMVYPYIIELNVLNPGGIGTIMNLTGHNLASSIVDRVIL